MCTRHNAQVAGALGEAAITAVEAALALMRAWIVDDPAAESRESDDDWRGFGLIDRAYLLIAGQHSSSSRRLKAQLLDTAWTAYMLTGEATLVETISSLAEECRIPQDTSDGLAELILQTIPRSLGEVPRLPSGEDAAQAAIADHALARAGWLS